MDGEEAARSRATTSDLLEGVRLTVYTNPPLPNYVGPDAHYDPVH